MRNQQTRRPMQNPMPSQTRNMSRDMKELEAVYEGILQENTASDDLNETQNRCLASGTGPEAADNFEEAKVDPKKMSDKEKEDNEYGIDRNSQNIEKKEEKPIKEKVNNFTMSKNTSDFDKLFNTVMEGGEFEEFGGEDDLGGEEDPLGGYGEEDDGGGEVSISVPAHVADALRELVDLLPGPEGEEDGDFDPIEDEENLDDAPLPEGTEVHDARPQPDTTGKMTSKNNKVGNLKPSGAASYTGAEAKQEPLKTAPDGKGKLQGKNNKVGGKSQSAFGGH